MITLGEILLECIDFEQLLMEGKDPVEILHHKYGAVVPEDVIDKVVEIDPTKKKSYSQWALFQYKTEPDLLKQSIKNGRLEKLFQYVQEHKEVQIKDIPSLSNGLDNYVPQSDLIFTPSDDEDANDYEVVYDDKDWRICVPHTYEADEKLGKDTRWCTAGYYGNGRDYWKRYSDDTLFVNFDKREEETLNGKTYPYKRYQFHFKSHSFMDADDDPVEGESLREILPQDVMGYYESEGYDTSSFVSEEERYERYEEWRYSVSYKINDELALMPMWDDDMEINDDVDAELDYYIYNTEYDDRDPIDWHCYIFNTSNGIRNVVESDKDGVIILNDSKYDTQYAIIRVYEEEVNWRDYGYTVGELHSIERSSSAIAVILEMKVSVFKLFVSTSQDEWAEAECGEGSVYINNQCPQESGGKYTVCVEVMTSEGYQLFGLTKDYQLDKIINNDFPYNGKHYFASDDGVIYGQFYRYALFQSEKSDSRSNFQVVKRIDKDHVLVEFEDGMQNIYSLIDKKLICVRDFTKLSGAAFDSYVCMHLDSLEYVINANGDVVSKGYPTITLYSRQIPLFVGRDKDLRTLIDPQQGEIETFEEIVDSVGASNEYVIAKLINGEHYVLYDLKNKKIVPLDMNPLKLGSYNKRCLDLSGHVILLGNDGADSSVLSIYDVDKHKIILPHIKSLRGVNDYDYIDKNTYNYIITFMDESKNIFDAQEERLIFNKNVSDIEQVKNEYDAWICAVYDGGKISFYDIKRGKTILAINQTDSIEPYRASMERILFYCKPTLSYISYLIQDGTWYENRYGEPIDAEHPELQERYKQVFQEMGIIDNNSIKESFDRIFGKIRR